MKADYHGALLKVLNSKCHSLVGLQGIVIFDTKFTFTIVCKDNMSRSKCVNYQLVTKTFNLMFHCFETMVNLFQLYQNNRASLRYISRITNWKFLASIFVFDLMNAHPRRSNVLWYLFFKLWYCNSYLVRYDFFFSLWTIMYILNLNLIFSLKINELSYNEGIGIKRNWISKKFTTKRVIFNEK